MTLGYFNCITWPLCVYVFFVSRVTPTSITRGREKASEWERELFDPWAIFFLPDSALSTVAMLMKSPSDESEFAQFTQPWLCARYCRMLAWLECSRRKGPRKLLFRSSLQTRTHSHPHVPTDSKGRSGRGLASYTWAKSIPITCL